MTDNRDIDEILASLDALLREGGSHNDDMAVEVESEQTGKVDVDSSDGEASEQQQDAAEEVFESVQDGVQVEPEDAMPRVVLTEDMLVENPQVRLPIDFAEPSKPATSAAESEGSHDVLVQGGGRLEQETQNSPASDDGEQAGDEQPIYLHKHEVERLLTLVSLDVSNHMQRLLPQLIKDSLHKHLANMQHESDKNNKTSDDE